MKAMLSIIVAVVLINITQAQIDTKFVYCEITGFQKPFSSEYKIAVDFGEEKKIIRDESGKMQSFKSMIDALNYMSENGWDFVQAYSVVVGAQPPVNHYLLRKKL